MAGSPSLRGPEKTLEETQPDLFRWLLKQITGELVSAEADARSAAGHSERSSERVNARNGYQVRPREIRLRGIDLRIPKLRHEGRAADLTTSPRAGAKLGRLARLAVDAGLGRVFFEDSARVHVSEAR